jgi:hypothetical protein
MELCGYLADRAYDEFRAPCLSSIKTGGEAALSWKDHAQELVMDG